MPRNSACRQAESGSARISSRLPADLLRAPVTRPWKWWTMSGHWADRPLAPRCSTKSPQIPHGGPLLFSIWAIQSCRPTPAPAVLFKRYSSDGPDPAEAPPRALERGAAAWGTPSIEAANLPLIEGDCALVVIHFPKQGRGSIQKGSVATTRQGGSYFPQARFWITSGRRTTRKLTLPR